MDVGFQGQIRDEATFLYQMGYRWYNSSVGRWLSVDPVELLGGYNCYVFALNSPTDELDVYGLSSASENRIRSHLEMRGEISDLLRKQFAQSAPQCINPCELITVVVNVVSDAAKGYGHTGVVVRGRLFDWGPVDGGSDLLCRGVPFWSNRSGVPFEGFKYSEQNLEGAGEFVVEVQICVCKSSADRVEKYWEDKFKPSFWDTFSVVGVFGSSCASSARSSLLAMRTSNSFMLSISTSDAFITPMRLLAVGLAQMSNDCGSSKGTKPYAKIAYESYK